MGHDVSGRQEWATSLLGVQFAAHKAGRLQPHSLCAPGADILKDGESIVNMMAPCTHTHSNLAQLPA